MRREADLAMLDLAVERGENLAEVAFDLASPALRRCSCRFAKIPMRRWKGVPLWVEEVHTCPLPLEMVSLREEEVVERVVVEGTDAATGVHGEVMTEEAFPGGVVDAVEDEAWSFLCGREWSDGVVVDEVEAVGLGEDG